MKLIVRSVILAVVCAAAAPVVAQQQAPVRITAQIPLRVQLVVSRFQGDKKISSVPYTLAVVANDNKTTNLRMGVEVPVARDGGPSYSYRSVGTTIECNAQAFEGATYKLGVELSDSSIVTTAGQGDQAAPVARVAGMPAFRSFTSAFQLLLKDGQTAQHTVATDPVSGEVMKVDVTLTVLR